MVNPPEPATPDQLSKIRDRVSADFKQLAQLFTSIRSPLPTETGDGTTYKDTHPAGPPGFLETFRNFGFSDFWTAIEALKSRWTGELCDDKMLLMEHVIKCASDLAVDSYPSNRITDSFLTKLYGDLKHPPESYLSKKFKYRQPDGSYNSLLYPQLGAANTPYARTVKPMRVQRGALPDPAVIFDSIMARKESVKHENGISSMLFYLATIIIHDIFRTDHADFSNSLTSSYLDLAPLYGSNETEQEAMRTHEDGKIHPDCFSETRILGFPLGVGCLLIMFNRFHNYVVENIALINEEGRFNKPSESSTPEKWKQYDEDLFQTGRLITCGLYINIILVDYVRTILNLNRTNSNWQLNPRAEFAGCPPLGQGNQVSAEFNMIYRWHSTLSDRDEEWTKNLYSRIFGKEEDLEMPEFLQKLYKLDVLLNSQAPQDRQFGELKRNDSGSFDDDDLVKILTESIEDCANAFGAQRVPKILKLVDVLGIEQARRWNLATLNEFRQHFDLVPYKTFEEMTPDSNVAEELRRLYDEPDLVELYPGLVVENTKPAELPGSGLMTSNTISRAILSDAVALVRGDRFYTNDYHPKQLTNWGFAEAGSDISVDNGCVFYKLILKSFPNHFAGNSVYAHYPLTIPKETRTIFERLTVDGNPDVTKDSLYDFGQPSRKDLPIEIQSYDTITTILNDKETYGVTWGSAMEFLMGKPAANFMLAGDQNANAESRKLMSDGLYCTHWYTEVKNYYERKTQQLLDEKSYKVAGVNQVDIVRDIGNLVHVHFCSELFSLPLKTEEFPFGIFTEHEMYLIMAAVFTTVFFDLDPEHSFQLRQASREATQQLGQLVEANVKAIQTTGYFSNVIQYFEGRGSILKSYGVHMIQKLLASDPNVDDLVWGNIMGTAGGMVANQGQLFAQMIDYYFSPEGSKHLPAMHDLALQDTPEADEKLLRYVLEGSRLYCGSAVFRAVSKDNAVIQDGSKSLHLKKGDTIFLNFNAASRDIKAFPDPEQVKLDRPIERYIQFGWGPHQCLGLEMTKVALTAVLKVVMRLPNLRPVKGLQGKIKKVPSDKAGYWLYLQEGWDGYFPFPMSMKVNWDQIRTASSPAKG